MGQAGNKTGATVASVAEFIAAVPDPRRRAEGEALDALHRRVTGHDPQMWGKSLIGYGRYHFKYASGGEGDAMRAGFSPRKAAQTIYLMGSYCKRQDAADALFARLGKHKRGASCLYISRLDAIDMSALEELIALSWKAMNDAYPD